MLKEMLEGINEVIEYKEGDMLSPLNKCYFPKLISKDNFHVIEMNNENNEDKENNGQPDEQKRLCFIDGGSAELLRAPNFSLTFIRIYANTILENRTLGEKRVEFYCLAKTKVKEDKIFYEVKILKNEASPDVGRQDSLLPDVHDLELFSYDKTIVSGENRAEISKLGDIARRFSELRMAKAMTDDLKEGDVIILDGNLRATYTNEELYLDALYEKAKNRGIIVAAIAKTSNLLTDKGNNMINVLADIAATNSITKPWFYHPVADIEEPKHKAEMGFLKLNQASEYIFRFEMHKEQFDKERIMKILNLLVSNSNDYSFPGYPYGLIKADQLARVSNQEKEFLRAKILLGMKKENLGALKKCLNALNAHDVLDKQ